MGSSVQRKAGGTDALLLIWPRKTDSFAAAQAMQPLWERKESEGKVQRQRRGAETKKSAKDKREVEKTKERCKDKREVQRQKRGVKTKERGKDKGEVMG